MFSRLFRQYRRFLFGWVLIGLGVIFVSYTGEIGENELGSTPVIAAISMVLAVTLIMTSLITPIALLIPNHLPMIEIGGVALIFSGLVDPVWRWIEDALNLPGWTYCILLCCCILFARYVLYGDWHPKSWRCDLKPRTTVFKVPGSPETIWKQIVPDPAHSGSYYWPAATFLPPRQDSDADFLLSLPRRGGYKDALDEIRIEHSDAPKHIIYRAVPMVENGGVAERIEFKIAEIGNDSCSITYTRQLFSVSPSSLIFLYFSNGFRDSSASLRARLCGYRDHSLQGLQMQRG